MNLRVPLNAGNFLTRSEPVSFSRRTLFHGVSKCKNPIHIFYYTTVFLSQSKPFQGDDFSCRLFNAAVSLQELFDVICDEKMLEHMHV